MDDEGLMRGRSSSVATVSWTTPEGASVASTLRLKVRTLTGRTIDVIVPIDGTALHVKQEIEKTPDIGVPPSQQRLIFQGRELADTDLLVSGPVPIENDSVLHLMLRKREMNVEPAAQPPVLVQMPFNQHGYGEYPGVVPVNMQQFRFEQHPARILPETRYNLQLLRTRSTNRIFGVGALVVGAIEAISGLSTLSWSTALIGVGLLLVGVLGIRTSHHHETRFAQHYFYGVLALMLFAGVVLSVDQATSGSGVLAILFWAILFPLLTCGACALVAYRHLRFCRLRDQAVVNPAPAAAEGRV